jgi:hypothetical protein
VKIPTGHGAGLPLTCGRLMDLLLLRHHDIGSWVQAFLQVSAIAPIIMKFRGQSTADLSVALLFPRQSSPTTGATATITTALALADA